MDTTKQPGLQIAQILLLGAKFAHREDALALPTTTPIANLPIQFEAKIGGKSGEQSAAVRLRMWTPPERTDVLYALDIEVAAIISATPGQENMDPFEYAKDVGPVMLFPFLREAVANITMKGRFGPLWIHPLNLVAAQQGATTALEMEPVP